MGHTEIQDVKAYFIETETKPFICLLLCCNKSMLKCKKAKKGKVK